jgi:hypothetical protein
MSASTCTWASTAELEGDTPSISVDSPPPVSKQSAAVFSGFCLVCCLLKWMMVSVKMANVAGTWINVETLQLEECELIISLPVSMNKINRMI